MLRMVTILDSSSPFSNWFLNSLTLYFRAVLGCNKGGAC
jgi:hypothetical protein